MNTWAWFSCGAASAVATKKAIETCASTQPVYCNLLADEHPDNSRFLLECQTWFGRQVKIIRNDSYSSVNEVFERVRYMSGIAGSRCTTEMKKVPRCKLAQADDVHIFGFTADKKEQKRRHNFELSNPDMLCKWPLIDLGITKSDCFRILSEAKIELPAMYYLGYRNNNCIGCVKSSSPGYWSKIRRDFHEVFERRCKQSRAIGCRLIEIHYHERIFLDELPDQEFPYKGENLSCGPECGSHL